MTSREREMVAHLRSVADAMRHDVTEATRIAGDSTALRGEVSALDDVRLRIVEMADEIEAEAHERDRDGAIDAALDAYKEARIE